MDQVGKMTIDCQQCGKGFASRHSMRRHTRLIHGSGSSDTTWYVFMTKEPVYQYECNNVVEFMRTNCQLRQVWGKPVDGGAQQQLASKVVEQVKPVAKEKTMRNVCTLIVFVNILIVLKK